MARATLSLFRLFAPLAKSIWKHDSGDGREWNWHLYEYGRRLSAVLGGFFWRTDGWEGTGFWDSFSAIGQFCGTVFPSNFLSFLSPDFFHALDSGSLHLTNQSKSQSNDKLSRGKTTRSEREPEESYPCGKLGRFTLSDVVPSCKSALIDSRWVVIGKYLAEKQNGAIHYTTSRVVPSPLTTTLEDFHLTLTYL
ncbi:uncharacterized protein CLUP02_10411 [Colletotrichum lupini]|uniref:Uncharacterized protein n=1 Tax=Colletotrichum lupini TaxID=145971 RepID=A0A9Q8SWV2_9PEZI|nr:uncharacterized protein CLUP02_10411 [Colletotrichum lupini]UQC84915.1 hypothetical protein CLUP02_10411 [Colletotrichum lupini]